MSISPARYRLVSAVTVVLALAGCGASRRQPTHTASPPAQRPCRTQSAITQSPSGRISGCLLVGQFASGRYTVALDDTLEFASLYSVMRAKLRAVEHYEGRRGVPAQLVTELRLARLPQPPVSVTLSPASGPPGTRVQVTGTLRRSVAKHASTLQVCWDGCLTGLDLGGSRRVRWISPRTFVTRVRIPSAPWLEGGGGGVVRLRDGSYPVSVTCVTDASSCLLAATAEGTARFTLRDARPPRWCERASACATLTVSPQSVVSGALVRLSGYVPLVQWDDGADRFGGTVSTIAGRHSVPEASLTRQSTQVQASFGHAALRVVGGAQLAEIRRLPAGALVRDGQAPIAADPNDPQLVAACDGRSIMLWVGGRHVTVPTQASIPVLAREGMYRPGAPFHSSCADVLPLGRSTLLAAFQGQTGAGTGIFADYPVETRDGGRSWQALPVPAGAAAATFGGFRTVGRGAQAVFASAGAHGGPPDAVVALVEATTGAALRWRAAHLSCPARGPCLSFGPFLPGNCAMGISSQDVLRSTDGGRRWRLAPTLTPGQLACGEGTLVMLGRGRALLIDALSAHPVQATRDGGVRWQSLALPTPPTASLPEGVSDLNIFAPAGITVLPSGALLLSGEGRGVALLEPSAHSWCAASGPLADLSLSRQASALVPIGSRLWWLDYGSAPAGRPQPLALHALSLADIRCH